MKTVRDEPTTPKKVKSCNIARVVFVENNSYLRLKKAICFLPIFL